MTYTITITGLDGTPITHDGVHDFEMTSTTFTVQISDPEFWVYPLAHVQSVHVVAVKDPA